MEYGLLILFLVGCKGWFYDEKGGLKCQLIIQDKIFVVCLELGFCGCICESSIVVYIEEVVVFVWLFGLLRKISLEIFVVILEILQN